MPKWIAVIGFLLCLYPNSCLAIDPNFIIHRPLNFESFKIIKTASGICPQNRKTETAPGRYLKKTNPLSPTKENIEKGKNLFLKNARPTACKLCHGSRGNGNGHLARGMEPPPRNFTCGKVMEDLPDGQLFWIIQNGSRGTAMPAHRFSLSKEQIWQLILYVRKLLET
ncbi:MAG: c-type cytochrome [Nitrospinae bacterium]|nr:c-type cytochrome [Nitrospinota bacterium]MZH05798.1 c-type cytochrome [Nitrospinota bacterium]MZH14100.1 c-type cytochrome [Nitrospinota bacterium]